MDISLKEFGTYDLVVVGGGCTGVFAAVRAARLGLKVAIVEQSGCFGGVATNGLVNIWHSLYDVDGKEQIIAGLTEEVERALCKDGFAVTENTPSAGIHFDPNAMKWVLDRLVRENGVHAFLHTFYGTLVQKGSQIERIVVSNKDGMGTLSARFFIDATGDGDLCRDVGLLRYTFSSIQPPSPCCIFSGKINGDIATLMTEHGAEFGLGDDWGWDGMVPGFDDLTFRADFHILDKLCSDAGALTDAEIEGRQKLYAFASLIKQYDNPKSGIAALCAHIGIRETVHYETLFRATEHDLLRGKAYDNAVLKGSYRIDIHHCHDNGITFKYLDGKKVTQYGKGNKTVEGDWREEEGLAADYARYYQVPFAILVQNQIANLIPVGRMLHADEGAFGALRVMVNLNQLGEAAGAAAYLSLHENKAVFALSGDDVQTVLRRGGSAL